MDDIITAAAILVNQGRDTQNNLAYIFSQAIQIQELANQSNSTPAISPQVKAIVASMDANMVSLNSQCVLLQNAIDEIARIVKE